MNTTALREDLEQIEAVEARLSALTEEFAHAPQLLAIYSQPLSYRLNLLRNRLKEHATLADEDTDVWIRLTGPAIGAGSAPMELLTAFMDRFRIATKHAVSALQGVAHTSGRFLGEVEAATNFQLVATAPGSFRLGLQGAPLARVRHPPGVDLFQIDVVADAIRAAQASRALGLQGIGLLIQALEAADDPLALQQLRATVEDHGTLRILYHARSLFPRGVDGVEFSGGPVGAPRRFGAAVKDRLREIGEGLVQTERYIGGVGVVQALDVSRRTLRIDYAKLPDLPEISSVSADYPEGLERVVDRVVRQHVAFAGTLVFDQKGVPQRLSLDSLEVIEPDDLAMDSEQTIMVVTTSPVASAIQTGAALA